MERQVGTQVERQGADRWEGELVFPGEPSHWLPHLADVYGGVDALTHVHHDVRPQSLKET